MDQSVGNGDVAEEMERDQTEQGPTTAFKSGGGLIRELLQDAKETALEGGGMRGLKSRLVTKTARLVLSSQVWLHATPTRDCDLLLTLPPGHPEAPALLTWLIDQIRRKERRLRMEVRYHEQTDTYGVYFSARYDSLLKGAELLQLKKRLKDPYGGGLREFVYDDADCFEGVENRQAFLTSRERTAIVKQLVEGVRAKEGGERLKAASSDQPPLFVVRTGQSIVNALINQGFIADLQPLHEQDQLAFLREHWVTSIAPQPIDRIKDYFGTQIGMYFAWLGHYTLALTVPALLGVLIWWWGMAIEWRSEERRELVSDLCFVGFALLNCLWGTIWIESWKRRQAELAYSWGTLGMEQDLLAEPRPAFYGVLTRSPVTGRMEPDAPPWRRRLIRYCVSYPIILVCILTMFTIMMLIFKWQEWTNLHFGNSYFVLSWVTFVPKIGLGIAVFISDELFMRLARRLNDFENYRTDEAYDTNLIIKIILFQFVNSFTALFYIAFWEQNMQRLSAQLAALLITRQVIGNITEAGLPWLKERIRLSRIAYRMTRAMSDSSLAKHVSEIKEQVARSSEEGDPLSSPVSENALTADSRNPSSVHLSDDGGAVSPSSGRVSTRLPLPEFRPSGPQLTQAELESLLPKYESPLVDYLEMFIQLGYVLLFSPAFPLAAAAALVNNMVEIRVDGFKLCNTLQRPFARRVENIGVWMQAIEGMGMIGVMVNCALIGQSGLVQRLWPQMSMIQQLVLVVILEHLILGLKFVVSAAIPDVPNWVTVEMAKVEFRRREALKRERRLGGIRSVERRSEGGEERGLEGPRRPTRRSLTPLVCQSSARRRPSPTPPPRPSPASPPSTSPSFSPLPTSPSTLSPPSHSPQSRRRHLQHTAL